MPRGAPLEDVRLAMQEPSVPWPLSPADDRRFHVLCAGVVLLAVLLVVVHALEFGWGSIAALSTAAGFLFLSKAVIFGGVIEGQPYDPWELALIAWLIDLLVSILLLGGFARLERLAVVGPVLVRARFRAAGTLLQYPGLRRMALSGIAIFVFVPLPGSGAVTGTLIARIIGLTRSASLLAVGAGAGLAVMAYALVAQFLGSQWRELIKAPWVIASSLLVLVAFGWVAWGYVHRELSRG